MGSSGHTAGMATFAGHSVCGRRHLHDRQLKTVNSDVSVCWLPHARSILLLLLLTGRERQGCAAATTTAAQGGPASPDG